MSDTLHTLYRLFMPLVAMVVILAGVNISSELLQNTQKQQTALSVAYAQGCPMGVTKVVPPTCPVKDKKGNCVPGQVCTATVNGKQVSGTFIPGINCCLGNDFIQASQAKGGGGMEALSQMMQAVSQFFKPKQKQPQTPDYRPPKPVCTSLVVSPTLPLQPGESATLTWTLEGGKPDTIIVSPGVGVVTGFSVRVSPRSSTTYTVVATNERGSSTCPKARVYVGPRNTNGTDGVFDENTNTNTGEVDTWNVDANATQGRATSPSAYDDIWNPANSAQNATMADIPNEDEDYYDFLSTLGESDEQEQSAQEPADYSEYYYGDENPVEEFNWSDFEGEELSWDNADLQDEYVGETDINSLDLEVREENYGYYQDDYDYEYQEDTLAQNTNGLTNEEIYGVWNRPQSPATGGLGLSGGFGGGTGASNVPAVDLDVPEERTSIFAKIGRWLKNMFCFWCK